MRYLTLTVLAVGLALICSCTSAAGKAENASPGCEPGTTFTGDDGCSKCFCGDDVVACSSASCSGADVGNTDAGGGSGCDDGRASGESFAGPDGCSSCFCGDDGQIACTNIGCGNNTMCPPCAAPPSGDCVGSGPCGCGPYTCPNVDAGSSGGECGETTCASNELCMQLPGCPIGMANPPVCVPIPASCAEDLTCGCFEDDPCGGDCTTCSGIADGTITCDCGCRCASPDTLIATPDGERTIADLREGDMVYTVDQGAIVPAPLLRVGKRRAVDHHVLRVQLDDGAVLEMSPGHPTADGRLLADLREGEVLEGRVVLSAELIAYQHPYTHDILPSSSTGTYFAAGVQIGSTLVGSRPSAPLACR